MWSSRRRKSLHASTRSHSIRASAKASTVCCPPALTPVPTWPAAAKSIPSAFPSSPLTHPTRLLPHLSIAAATERWDRTHPVALGPSNRLSPHACATAPPQLIFPASPRDSRKPFWMWPCSSLDDHFFASRCLSCAPHCFRVLSAPSRRLSRALSKTLLRISNSPKTTRGSSTRPTQSTAPLKP